MPTRSGQKLMEIKWGGNGNAWVKGNLIVPKQLIDILCEENVEGDADQDRANNDGDDKEGVEMTNMADEDESDKD